MGESWGSILGVLAVQRRPDLYYAWIGSGQMVNVVETDRRVYRDLVGYAARTGDDALAAKLAEIGEPPYRDIPWANANLLAWYEYLYAPYTPSPGYLARGEAGGLDPFGILGSEYNLVEKTTVLRGLIDTFALMYPQLYGIDFRRDAARLEVPVYVLDGAAELEGRRDLALEWFEGSTAPSKTRITFEGAAHSVAFEQADAVARLLDRADPPADVRTLRRLRLPVPTYHGRRYASETDKGRAQVGRLERAPPDIGSRARRRAARGGRGRGRADGRRDPARRRARRRRGRCGRGGSRWGRGGDPSPRRSTWRPQRATPRSRARGTFPTRRGVGPCRCPTCSTCTPRRETRPLRELGLVSIPVDEIVGTAVMGPAQRGLDFQPLPPFRSKNWEARWQRIRRATQEMRSLPPIDVLRTHDGYWVTDGHNRVAAAKVGGPGGARRRRQGRRAARPADHAPVGVVGARARGVVPDRGGRPRPAVAWHDAGSDGPGAGPPAAARRHR